MRVEQEPRDEIAAITIHFRDAGLTAGCVDSLLVDGWNPIMVWDNSADGGRSLAELRARYSGNRRLMIVDNAQNLGFAHGMNSALKELGASGYKGPVLLINNDATVRKGMRDAVQAGMRGRRRPLLISPRIMQRQRSQGWRYYHPWLALETGRRLPGSFGYLSGCCLLVDRKFNAAPLFDESFFMYGEDVELSWRWRKEGSEIVLLEDVWVDHGGSASSGHASRLYERCLVRSHWLLASRLSEGSGTSALMKLLRVPMLGLRALIRSLRYRSLVPLRALTAAIDGDKPDRWAPRT